MNFVFSFRHFHFTFSVTQCAPSLTQLDSRRIWFLQRLPGGSRWHNSEMQALYKALKRMSYTKRPGLSYWPLPQGLLWEAVSLEETGLESQVSSDAKLVTLETSLALAFLSFLPSFLLPSFLLPWNCTPSYKTLPIKVFLKLWFLGNPNLWASSLFLKLKYKDITSFFPFLPPISPVSPFISFQSNGPFSLIIIYICSNYICNDIHVCK